MNSSPWCRAYIHRQGGTRCQDLGLTLSWGLGCLGGSSADNEIILKNAWAETCLRGLGKAIMTRPAWK
ncbi:MAG TPA: hypothetical protein VND64_07050 [Pirellulales bacterium]|nr:hypothetical protein [Pirellulales bacterium]